MKKQKSVTKVETAHFLCTRGSGHGQGVRGGESRPICGYAGDTLTTRTFIAPTGPGYQDLQDGPYAGMCASLIPVVLKLRSQPSALGAVQRTGLPPRRRITMRLG